MMMIMKITYKINVDIILRQAKSLYQFLQKKMLAKRN